jgi:hypothetical protein
VREAQTQREPLEHPPEHEPRHGERGLHRVAHELGEPVVGLPVGVRDAARVQEHERPAVREQRPQVVVHRVVQLPSAAPAADRDAGHPELVKRSDRLLGRSGPAERYRAECEQAVRGVRDVRRELVVALRDDPPREAVVHRGRGEEERRQRHDVVVDAFLVHLGQPDVRVVLRSRQRQRRARPDAADLRVQPHDTVGDPGEVGEPGV